MADAFAMICRCAQHQNPDIELPQLRGPDELYPTNDYVREEEMGDPDHEPLPDAQPPAPPFGAQSWWA